MVVFGWLEVVRGDRLRENGDERCAGDRATEAHAMRREHGGSACVACCGSCHEEVKKGSLGASSPSKVHAWAQWRRGPQVRTGPG